VAPGFIVRHQQFCVVQGVLGFDVLVQGRQVYPAQFVAQLAAVQLTTLQRKLAPPAAPLSAWPSSERRVSRCSFKDFDWCFFMVLSLENAFGTAVGPARSCSLSPVVSRALSKSCPKATSSPPATAAAWRRHEITEHRYQNLALLQGPALRG
jgi:hypothetical protein